MYEWLNPRCPSLRTHFFQTTHIFIIYLYGSYIFLQKQLRRYDLRIRRVFNNHLSVCKDIHTEGAAEMEGEGLTGSGGAQVVESRETTTRCNNCHQKRQNKKQSSGAGMLEYQQSALIKSHPVARKWPFLPQDDFLFVSYISGSGCPLVSLRRRESQPCLPLTTNEASLSAADSHHPL